jgi:hypothetical protein
VGYGYEKLCVTVESESGETVRAMTYYVKDDTNKNPSLKPYSWYKKHVLVGAKEARLPPDYIKIIEEVKAKEDPCKKREWDELLIYC